MLQDIAKALCLFCIGVVMLVTIGDRFLKAAHRTAVAIASEPRPQPRTAQKEEVPAERPEPQAVSTAYAQACSAYDPIAHPEQTLSILEHDSAESCKSVPEIGETVCTPVDVIDAVWRNETGMVYGSGTSDTCDVMAQLEIRCAVGHSCGHLNAMKDMGARFGWDKLYGKDLENLRCSCGTATMSSDTHYYGGCCGPFQFSAAEIVDKAVSMNLDPMTFCGGAMIAAVELRDYYVRFRKEGTDGPNAWRRAISRYFGADSEGKYWAHAKAHWDQFHAWYEQGPDVLRARLAAQASYSVKILQKSGLSETAVVASY